MKPEGAAGEVALAGSADNETQIDIIPRAAVDELIRLTPSGRSAWTWIRLDGARVKDVVVEHDGVKVTRISTSGNVSPDIVAKAVLGALRRRSERRKASAAKGAETRRSGRAERLERIVEQLRAGGHLRPSLRCVLCRKVLATDESRARGIGVECWAGLLSAMESAS